MYKYGKIIINIFLILILFIVQFSFISGLPGVMSRINFVIIILIFILVLFNLKLTLLWSLGLGLLFGFFSFLPFGSELFCLLMSVVFSNFLFKNFFTNRSLYSFLLLTFFMSVFYNILMIILLLIYNFFDNYILLKIDIYFWENKFYELMLDFIIVVMLFYIINFFSKKLKPAFLVYSRK